MIRSRFSKHDRITISGIAYVPVDQNAEVVVLARMDNTGARERFSYEEIGALKERGNWQYERGFFATGMLGGEKPRTTFELDDLSPTQRCKAHFKFNMCEVIRELLEKNEIRLTDDSLNANREKIEYLVDQQEKKRNSAGEALRGGSALVVRSLPCSRTIRETYKKYRRSQRSLTGLLPRYKGSGRTFPDPEAAELLAECVQQYAQPDRPTKINVVQETVRRFAEENERRSAEGRRLLSCPSRRTIERSIDRLDPFHRSSTANGLSD